MSYGTLIVSDSTFAANSGLMGAAIMVMEGSATVDRCTFDRNVSQIVGGAFDNAGDMVVTNSAFSGNTAMFGGTISNTGNLQLVHCTVAHNTNGPTSGAVDTTAGGNVTLLNSLVAGNTPADCRAPTNGTIEGHSTLDSDGTCPSFGRISGLADELALYAGSIWTHDLLPGSNAIDAGDPEYCTETDQRGAPRVGVCDIGAFEFGGVVPEE